MAKQQIPDAMLPIMAQAALGGGPVDDTLKALLGELLQDALEQRRKEKDKKERLALSAVQAAKEQAEAVGIEQRRCSHKKQDGHSRLTGQYLSGTGQLALVCTFCAKNYHNPPLEGQEAAPRELIPSADIIGG